MREVNEVEFLFRRKAKLAPFAPSGVSKYFVSLRRAESDNEPLRHFRR
jgi:hypothetical protein